MSDILNRYPEIERPHRGDGSWKAIAKCLDPIFTNIFEILDIIDQVAGIKGLKVINSFTFQSRVLGTCKEDSDIDIYLQLDEQHRDLLEHKGATFLNRMMLIGLTKNIFMASEPKLSKELERRIEQLHIDFYMGIEDTPPTKPIYEGYKHWINLQIIERLVR